MSAPARRWNVPEWMRPATPPLPERGRAVRPWIVDQRPGPNHTVRVTFATADLRRHVVTVPEDVWMRGEHLAIADLLPTVAPR